MEITKVIYNIDSFGKTRNSLKELRNALCERMSGEIAVIEVPTGKGFCCYLIIDKTKGEGVFTGNGFKTYGSGEGRAGFNTALLLFRIMGVRPHIGEDTDISFIWQADDKAISDRFLTIANDIAKEIGRYVIPVRAKPLYIRMGGQFEKVQENRQNTHGDKKDPGQWCHDRLRQ